MTTTPTPDLSTVPSPETLRPLLEAALAIMEPNDPAREDVSVSIRLHSNQSHSYRIATYLASCDLVISTKETITDSIEGFKIQYTPPSAIASRIAELKAELAKLEASK